MFSGYGIAHAAIMGMFPSFGTEVTKPSMRDYEDMVQKLLDEADPDLLALIYKSLYARGYRISTVDAQITNLRKKCG